ncbi:MAG: SAM-dependent methyltransferase [Planctomycetales bacterium]|nr:SAM-dependent methyltransferase [Planctomycetales bacterium]
MPKLDDRLKAVAKLIRSPTHADIGSDHGHLLKALLQSGRIDQGIAIENKTGPLNNSRKTLAGLNAEVRLADGLTGLQPGEADSLSLCGMGGELIVKILQAHPDRVPDDIVIQANRRPESVRRWAQIAGFHLVDETFVVGRNQFTIMRFHRNASGADPAYQCVQCDAGERFGPILIRRWQPHFVDALLREHQYLMHLAGRTQETQHRFEVLSRLLTDKLGR